MSFSSSRLCLSALSYTHPVLLPATLDPLVPAGVLLYYLLSGRTPFYAATMDGIIARVKTGTWVFKGTCWQDVSEHAKAVVRRMLQVRCGRWSWTLSTHTA